MRPQKPMQRMQEHVLLMRELVRGQKQFRSKSVEKCSCANSERGPKKNMTCYTQEQQKSANIKNVFN